MLDMPIHPCPFVRSVVGPRGTVLLRRHPEHEKTAVEAIRRRTPPAWSAGPGGVRWTPPAKRRAKRMHRRARANQGDQA